MFEGLLGGRHVEHVCMYVSVEALHGIGDAIGWGWLPNNDNFREVVMAGMWTFEIDLK
jgi:hypothetical protein